MPTKDLRRGTKCTFFRLGPDGRECVGDHSDEKVDEPEIKYDNGCDEEEARYEELRVDHAVHEAGPLKKKILFSI